MDIRAYLEELGANVSSEGFALVQIYFDIGRIRGLGIWL
jgi:hypothetical protein